MDKSTFLDQYESFLNDAYVSGGVQSSYLGACWPKWVRDKGGPTLADAGYQKHGQVLADLASSGRWTLIRPGTPEAAILRKDDVYSERSNSRNKASRQIIAHRVIPEIWRAFTFDAPNQKHLYIPPSTVQFGVDPTAINESQGFLIEPITAETQQSWAIEFAKLDRSIDENSVREAMTCQPWYIHLDRYFEKVSPGLSERWSKFRANHAIAEILKWKEMNKVPDSIFEGRANVQALQPEGQLKSPGDAVRHLAHRAIDKMSEPDLLSLQIPLYAVADFIRIRS